MSRVHAHAADGEAVDYVLGADAGRTRSPD
jgi:hypothetical protein